MALLSGRLKMRKVEENKKDEQDFHKSIPAFCDVDEEFLELVNEGRDE